MKIAVITCYHDPDYIRARTLRAALKTLPEVQQVVVKNTHTGILRYPEMLWKIWRLKHQENPDVYLLTFRGQEILPWVLWVARKKQVWFDEFIVPIAYATGEGHKRSLKKSVFYFLAKRSEFLYKRWLKRCAVILADTNAHAELSARTSDMNLRKYRAIPVGADETLFKPGAAAKSGDTFQVFYYSTGNQPLHGMQTVLEAAEILKHDDSIEFLFAGGKASLASAVRQAQEQGARVHHVAWIPFNDLVKTIRGAGVNLGGPFGNTQQAHHVITGKTYQMLACQAPVIVGASEATTEFFTDKKNALVVPQADPAALAKAIKWAAENPRELAGIAENGRKLYDKEFSTTAIARRLKPLVDVVS